MSAVAAGSRLNNQLSCLTSCSTSSPQLHSTYVREGHCKPSLIKHNDITASPDKNMSELLRRNSTSVALANAGPPNDWGCVCFPGSKQGRWRCYFCTAEDSVWRWWSQNKLLWLPLKCPPDLTVSIARQRRGKKRGWGEGVVLEGWAGWGRRTHSWGLRWEEKG